MFKKATRQQARLRMALCGPPGSGKTWTSLAVATRLGGPIAVIDTEHGSASKYSHEFAFDVAELQSFHPDKYIEVIHAAEKAGYAVLVIDSLSHAWSGADGALEQVDNIAKRSKAGNKFTAWADVTPMQRRLVDAMLACKAHVIATMRTKTEWVLEADEKGRQTPRRIGLAPVQRDGIEYEFDLVGDIDHDHVLAVSKTRCQTLDGACIRKPGAQLAEDLLTWLGQETVAWTPNEQKWIDWLVPNGYLDGERVRFLDRPTLKAAVAEATANGKKPKVQATVVELPLPEADAPPLAAEVAADREAA